MDEPDRTRAIRAAVEVASQQDLAAAEARVLHDSNKLTLRLLPCDVVARVAVAGLESFESELEIARRLAEIDGPVAHLEPRVEPRVHQRHGFAVTFWAHCEQASGEISPARYATALERLHDRMAQVEVAAPHFSVRVAEAEQLLASPDRSPQLPDPERALLAGILRDQRRAIGERSPAEQLLHGEPHPGNVLNIASGPLFVDLETCCRGPVEFDVAHVPEEVSRCYAGAEQELLAVCRLLALAMVTAWRWDRDDEFPDGRRAGQELLRALHAGPPWPSLDRVWPSRG
jgi:Phosphotransferase enzyme family